MVDGLLDLCIASETSKLKMIKLLLELINGTHMYDSRFSYSTIKNLKLNFNSPAICNVDGEIIKSSSYKFNVLLNNIAYYQESNEK